MPICLERKQPVIMSMLYICSSDVYERKRENERTQRKNEMNVQEWKLKRERKSMQSAGWKKDPAETKVGKCRENAEKYPSEYIYMKDHIYEKEWESRKRKERRERKKGERTYNYNERTKERKREHIWGPYKRERGAMFLRKLLSTITSEPICPNLSICPYFKPYYIMKENLLSIMLCYYF